MFTQTPHRHIRSALVRFLPESSEAQVKAWDSSIPPLQAEVGEVIRAEPGSSSYSAVLEYQLPYELRRPDVVLLISGAVVVLELKGKSAASQADLDQVAAYARDLRNYHRGCEEREVHAVLVPTRATGYREQQCGVHVCGPDALDGLIRRLDRPNRVPPLRPLPVDEFLSPDAYRPLPTIVEAARLLFENRSLPQIKRAHAATQPCLDAACRVIHEAARSKRRALIMVSGVPGSGKTLVGLQLAHARFLDDLAVARGDEKPAAPAVFLSGNGPLVQVLQHQLKLAGAPGKTFVRGVKEYVKYYSGGKGRTPPEHVLIYDEAQRAWDAAQVARSHEKKGGKGLAETGSEPELFVRMADQVPGWCTVVGLIGGGQEIHIGEEQGIAQWASAVAASARASEWSVHAPAEFSRHFAGAAFVPCEGLKLGSEIRTHFASHLHRLVGDLVDAEPLPTPESLRALARTLEDAGYPIRLTRDFASAKRHLRDRYDDQPERRFGLLMSARQRRPERLGVAPSESRFFPIGPWLADGDESTLSCRNLCAAATEFDIQGLELDNALLVWGTDFRLERKGDGLRWSNEDAKGYRVKPDDAMRLRRNAYRVLMTRGREGLTMFVPRLPELDLTYEYLAACGFRSV